MFCLDIFLESPAGKKTQTRETLPQTLPKFSHPLMCWDIVMLEGFQNPRSDAVQDLKNLAAKHQWIIDIAAICSKDFEALVVTDTMERISWVSRGFESMTGFSRSELLGQKPSILQGPNKDLRTTRKMRDAIRTEKVVKATLLNYKKDGSAYRCRIEIMPIYNIAKTLTHFLALEKSI